MTHKIQASLLHASRIFTKLLTFLVMAVWLTACGGSDSPDAEWDNSNWDEKNWQ